MYQLIEANFGLFSTSANGGGVAFIAHVARFIFGLLAARLLAGRDRTHPESMALHGVAPTTEVPTGPG